MMDGEVMANMIKNTLLFQGEVDVPTPSLSIGTTISLLKRLHRGFYLNIKNNESCVFFMGFLESGIACLVAISNHFDNLNRSLALNYNAKK
jgi:hypothetical protein